MISSIQRIAQARHRCGVAQTSKSGVSRVSKPAGALNVSMPGRFGNRRHSRLGNLRHDRAACPTEPSFLLGTAAVLLAVFVPGTAWANLPKTNTAPKLLPPYGELPPGFWEQHTASVVAGATVAALLIGCGLWLALRPRPKPQIPPAVQARTALNGLLNRPEDGALLSQVSQILRRYVLAAFGLPPAETTTTEFCQLIRGNDRIGAELATTLETYLRRCDEQKFAPAPAGSPLNGAAGALELVAQGETRLAQLRQSPSTPTAPVSHA
jgi:hypothetical protein